MTKHFGEHAATKAVITQNDLLRFTRMRLRDYEFTGIHSRSERLLERSSTESYCH
jgi:hypothetical protein